jgi:hypothetical protein
VHNRLRIVLIGVVFRHRRCSSLTCLRSSFGLLLMDDAASALTGGLAAEQRLPRYGE